MNTRGKPIHPVGDVVPWPGTERRTLEYFLVSYVPQTLKHASVNIAVVLVGDGFADVRFVSDWRRVMVIDPEADIEFLQELALETRDKLRVAGPREEMLRMMEDSWSNTIQLSPRNGCLTEDPTTEIETLASRYL